MKKKYVAPSVEWLSFQLNESINIDTSGFGPGDIVVGDEEDRDRSAYQLND